MVHRYLGAWKDRARQIPNPELRKQALMSIATKTFHCEGGAICALLAGERLPEIIRFIVAYQTISDYLDNLCDRSTSLDPDDFRTLHDSMPHALTPGVPTCNYYRHRSEQDDAGYLAALVTTCQEVLATLPNYRDIASALHELAGYYCELQVLKHVTAERRVPGLMAWFESQRPSLPDMSWYEFSACTGSTLGIFCLVSYATREDFTPSLTERIKHGYFPWVQGLHILLDYFIDQEEDRKGGDLNFCSYYESDDQIVGRVLHFLRRADESVAQMPHARFHQLINRGLLGIYLGDRKVREQARIGKMARRIGRNGGFSALFFYANGWLYRTLRG
jgi:tetraprenyl-beta-curcumene synthase